MMTEYTFEEIRKHKYENDAWIAINGNVYDITKFIPSHPAGSIILSGLGRDATILFETHHNLVTDIKKINNILKKYYIGIVKDYKPIVNFNTEFSYTLLERCREECKNLSHRDSFYTYSALVMFFTVFIYLIYKSFISENYVYAIFLGSIISIGHLIGHAGNHWSLSSNNYINKFFSMTCTNLWGLREKNWEFSHLISHHCYNYTDRDYIMEQHVPLQYFRVRECDPWNKSHSYQHILFLICPILAFFIGGLRLDCAPFIFISPFLNFLRKNRESPLPAPQFFASGSSIDEKKLNDNEDGVGPYNFVVFSKNIDYIISIIIANIIWMPLFFYNNYYRGIIYAIMYNFIIFATQSLIITTSLFTQHLCEDIKLQKDYKPDDDWYKLQIEASTTIIKSPISTWYAFGINLQTEHHMFPSLNPLLLIKIQPIVKTTAEEFGIQYNYFNGNYSALKSVYNQFKKLSEKPKNE